MQVIKYDGLLL